MGGGDEGSWWRAELATLGVSAPRPPLPEDDVLGILEQTIAEFPQSTDDQPAPWNVAAWQVGLGEHPRAVSSVSRVADRLTAASPGTGRPRITRRDLFALTDGDPMDMFVAVMAWGYGPTGYGCSRAARIIAAAGPRGIDDAIRAMREGFEAMGTAGVYKAFSRGGAARLHGLGPAFASKLAYFACYDRSTGTGPLIADARVAWGLWALTDDWDCRKGQVKYANYVAVAEKYAARASCRSDDIERALFELGPKAQHAYHLSKLQN